MESFVIAALGASAGGLKSITDFISTIDTRFPVAYVVTMHSTRDHKSRLPAILSKQTTLQVLEITQGILIQPYKIYVNPPGMKLSIQDGSFILKSRPESETINRSINYFFKSLAVSTRERAIGIIMSGTGQDGTEGLKAIEDYHGMTIVQDPDTAEFDGMPKHSIIFDHPDFILEPGQMAACIYDRVQSMFNLPIAVQDRENKDLQQSE